MKTLIEKKVIPGLIGASYSDSFLGKGIRFFQWMWVILYDRKNKNKPLWNHIFLTIERFGKVYIIEANSKATKNGYVNELFCNPWEFTVYGKGKVKYILREFKKPWTRGELIQMDHIARAFEGVPYDTIAIPQQIVKSITNKWIGKGGTDAEHQMICCEAAATIVNYVGVEENQFDNPASINVSQVINSEILQDYV